MELMDRLGTIQCSVDDAMRLVFSQKLETSRKHFDQFVRNKTGAFVRGQTPTDQPLVVVYPPSQAEVTDVIAFVTQRLAVERALMLDLATEVLALTPEQRELFAKTISNERGPLILPMKINVANVASAWQAKTQIAVAE